jgi:arylsulfatase A-like enzyme
VSIDHPRAPDLLFTTRRFDADGREHPLGHCLDLGAKPAAGSTHGGVHEEELKNVVFVQGPEFRESHVSEMTGGLIDIVPTMLHLLGIPQPKEMRGRPLADLMRDGAPCEDTLPTQETAAVSAGDYHQSLRFRRLTRRTLVDHGWRE